MASIFPHLVKPDLKPEHRELSGQLHEAHSRAVHYCLLSLNLDAQKSIADHSTLGYFNLEPPICVGQMSNSEAKVCDLYLAPGVAATAWPVSSGKGRYKTLKNPIELFTRRGTASDVLWNPFTPDNAWLVALPRYLTAKTQPRSIPRASFASWGFNFELELTSGHEARWVQIVWDEESRSFKGDQGPKTRIERGDPDSLSISYCEITIGSYTAIVVSSIVQEADGEFRPWTAHDPLQLPFGYYAPKPSLKPPHSLNTGTNLDLFHSATFTFHAPRPQAHHVEPSYALSHRKRSIYGQRLAQETWRF